jgi:hypothetical protein
MFRRNCKRIDPGLKTQFNFAAVSSQRSFPAAGEIGIFAQTVDDLHTVDFMLSDFRSGHFDVSGSVGQHKVFADRQRAVVEQYIAAFIQRK